MKNISFRSFLLFALAVLLLPGCSGLNKMKKNADQIQFKVTPELLETHAGKVNIAVNGRFPSAYFNKKAILTATPVLKYEKGETAFSKASVQGEKVHGNNHVISYNSGGILNYNDAVTFTEIMRRSELIIEMTASRKKKSVTFRPVKVADGVLATSTLISNYPKAIRGDRREANTSGKYDPNIDPFQRIVSDEMMADILYKINRSNLLDEEITKSDILDYLKFTEGANIDDRIEIKGIQVSAYASPDGSIDFNTELASKRKDTSSDFLAQKLKDMGVDINPKTRYTPEDWEGFKSLVEKSNIQDKDLILRVLSMYTDPEVREREIRNLSEAFTVLSDHILPQLRRAKLQTNVEVMGKTDEELIALAISDPSSLNPAELLYAATLFDDLENQLKVYNSFIKIYPNDWRGPNNAGYVLTQQMKYKEAKPLFEKAEQLKNDEPIIKNNLGVISLFENNINEAEALFGAAAGSGKEVNYNLGIISLKNNNYDQGIRYFNDFQDINTALAKILVDDNNGALRDLEAFDAPNCYMKPYLKAIIGARTARENMLFEGLKEAFNINADMKNTAKNDLEFIKYYNNQQFIDITK